MRIHASAVRLAGIAARWAETVLPPERVLGLLDEVRQVRACIQELLREFQSVGEWLLRGSAGTAVSDLTSVAVPAGGRGLAHSLGENQRLSAKDRIAADMNSLVAWLLQQVVHLLDDLPLRTGGGEKDLLDRAAYGDTLRAASRSLENASHMAHVSERFVEDIDFRWLQLRHEVATVVGLARR